MASTIRNEFDKKLTYENLRKAHFESRKCKRLKKDIIMFELKQEDYIRYLYEELKNGTYKHRWIYNILYQRAKIKKNRKIKIYG